MTQYPNSMDQMVSNNLTNTKLYSLWLDSPDSKSGNIPFGGIDTEKYCGTLKSMPIYPDDGGDYSSFAVGLKSISYIGDLNNSAGTTFTNLNVSTSVVLGSSTTLIYLPIDITKAIYNTFEGFEDIRNDIAVVWCGFETELPMSFTFESGSVVNVSSTDLMYQLPDNYRPHTGWDGNCGFGVRPTPSGAANTLGDIFLRSAYVGYDLTNNEIAIAQSITDSDSSNIVEVPAGATSIPELAGQPVEVDDSEEPTQTSAVTSGPRVSSSPSPTSTSPGPVSTTKKSHATASSINVGVLMAVVVAVPFAVGF